MFVENVRPIRCRKIRYFADRRFRARLLPPPDRPAATKPSASVPYRRPKAAPSSDGGDALSVVPDPAQMPAATLADIERIESLTLSDFPQVKDLNFEHRADRPTPSEFQADVEKFLGAMR